MSPAPQPAPRLPVTFDPYHKWLGIPPGEQPADHYRLLAIARFESDPDVIETAADQRMALMRTLQTGSHSALSQKLLNELSAARLCLLAPERKAAYDGELRRRLAAAQPTSAALPVGVMVSRPQVPVATLAPFMVTDSGLRNRTTKKGVSLSSRSLAWLILAAVSLPAFAWIGYLVTTKASTDGKRAKRDAPPASSQQELSPVANQPASKPELNPPAPQPPQYPATSLGDSPSARSLVIASNGSASSLNESTRNDAGTDGDTGEAEKVSPGQGKSEAGLARPARAIAPFNAIQARTHQEAWAKHLGVPIEQANSVGMKFVLIPPGEFMMGSTPEEIEAVIEVHKPEQDWFRSEAPQHKVVLTRPFYLGVHEVTQKEYESVMGVNPSCFAKTGPDEKLRQNITDLDTANHPVENVSWNDAAEFCAKLSQKEGLKPFYVRAGQTVTGLQGTGYRLPTEAEWEFAGRAGTTTKFWNGDEFRYGEGPPAAWFAGSSGDRTHAVGELARNPFGLFDVHGNVSEWVEDAWQPTFYEQFAETPAIDPKCLFSSGPQRVTRGGYWGFYPYFGRSAFRRFGDSSGAHNSIGFRVVLAPAPVPADVEAFGPESEGFVALFNGKDLTGWKPYPGREGLWRAERGVLIGSGPVASYLFSERGNFTNFHLRFEVRINDGGNSGVFGRSNFTDSLVPGGYEAQINSTGGDTHKTGSIYGSAGKAVQSVTKSIVPPNEWFTLELIATDNHIVVKVNGEMTASYVDSGRSFPMGHIALQQHDPQTVVEFRKIEIKESTPAKSEAAPRTASNDVPRGKANEKKRKALTARSEPPPPGDRAKDKEPAKLTATEAFSLEEHTGMVTHLAFNREWPVLASASKDGHVLLWNLENRTLQLKLHWFPEWVSAIKFSPNSSVLAFANCARFGSTLNFKTLTGQELKVIKDFQSRRDGSTLSIAYSHDGLLLAAGQEHGSIRLWDTDQDQEILPPVSLGVGHSIYSLAFGPLSTDRRRRQTEYLLAAACRDGTVKTYTATLAKTKKDAGWTFAPTGVPFPKAAPVTSVRFSPDGKLLGYTRDNGQICVGDPRTGATVRVLAHEGQGINVCTWIAFHPKQPWCVTAHIEPHVARIWNAETAEMLCELKGHTGGVMCAEFSPDGRHVATASEDLSVKVWDLSGPDVPGAAKAKRSKKVKLAAPTVGN